MANSPWHRKSRNMHTENPEKNSMPAITLTIVIHLWKWKNMANNNQSLSLKPLITLSMHTSGFVPSCTKL